MKTYFRKNSSYLKKAFVASNFNEMCRLCLSEVDFLLVPIFQDRHIPYQELIQYSVDVSVEEGDGLPTSVCKECLGMVEKSYLFKKKCQMNDSKLREHLRLLDLNEENKLNERFEDESDSTIVETDIEKEVSSTSLPVLKTDDQDVRTNDELNSSSHEEKNSAENESYNAKGADSSESSQSETAISIVSVSGNYEDSSENKKEVQEANTENEDHFEVLKLPVTSKIKRYEREKNKPNKKKEPSLKNKIDETVDTETETELIYMLSDNDESTSKNCQNESEECSILQLSSVDDDEQTLQSKEEVKSSATIIKVYSLVESDSDEDMEIALGGRELVAKSDRIEEIVELWDEEEMGVEDLKEEEDIENGVEENQSNDDNIFLNEGLTHEMAEKTNDSFQIHVEENGVLKTHEFYMIKKESNVPSKSSEEIPVSGSKKTTVVPKVFNKCSICKAGFESRSEIKDHMFSKHKDSLDYCTCTVCFKNFSCPNSLKRHSLVHTGTKPYSCEICKRRFSQSSILKRHRFTHNELKPFQCHFCKKSYTQKMNLLIHLRNHGFKGQKEKHKCYLCDKKFVHHSGLSRHLKLHKGEMSFCPLCNKSFTDSSAMLRHVRSIHKQYPVSS